MSLGLTTLFRTNSPKISDLPNDSVESVKPTLHQAEKSVSDSEAEIRRQMYVRIARGNALVEVEENARHPWYNN